MQIESGLIVAMVNIVVALLILYLVLSGRLEGVLRALSRSLRGSQQSPEPLRLMDFSKDTKGKTWDAAKKKE